MPFSATAVIVADILPQDVPFHSSSSLISLLNLIADCPAPRVGLVAVVPTGISMPLVVKSAFVTNPATAVPANLYAELALE